MTFKIQQLLKHLWELNELIVLEMFYQLGRNSFLLSHLYLFYFTFLLISLCHYYSFFLVSHLKVSFFIYFNKII